MKTAFFGPDVAAVAVAVAEAEAVVAAAVVDAIVEDGGGGWCPWLMLLLL